MIKYIIKYSEAFELIKQLEGKASDIKGGVNDSVCSMIGDADYGTYYDLKGHVTAGIGHKLNDRELAQYVSDVKVKARWDNLTEAEALAIYRQDFIDHVHHAIYLTPELDELPNDVASQIIAATFRGSWGLSETTRQLFHEGKYQQAASEFLNNDEYHNTKSSGIKKRMEDVADAIRSLDTLQMCYSDDPAVSTTAEIVKPNSFIDNQPHEKIVNAEIPLCSMILLCMIPLAVAKWLNRNNKEMSKWQINLINLMK